jgi:hypothetical protein
MKYLIAAILTFAVTFAILNILKKNEKKVFKKYIYRQSDMHEMLKTFFSKTLHKGFKETQMKKRNRENSISILSIDDKAYWVINNVFYVTNMIDGNPDMSNAQPIDTSNMSKEDIDKMLFILDNLDKGDKDERGSTGN